MDKKIEQGVKNIINSFGTIVRTHGGDITISKIEGRKITLSISGACANCHLFDLSYNKVLKSYMKEKFPSVELLFTKKSKRILKTSKYAQNRIPKKQTGL